MTPEQIKELLERLTVAQTVTDANIAAGIALNELLRRRRLAPHQPTPDCEPRCEDPVSPCTGALSRGYRAATFHADLWPPSG